MSMWVLAVLLLVLVALVWWKPFYCLHPRLAYHHLILKHQYEAVPVGFADWDVICECGIKGEL